MHLNILDFVIGNVSFSHIKLTWVWALYAMAAAALLGPAEFPADKTAVLPHDFVMWHPCPALGTHVLPPTPSGSLPFSYSVTPLLGQLCVLHPCWAVPEVP